MACPLAALANQRIWTDKAQYADAERKLHSKLQNDSETTDDVSSNPKINVDNYITAVNTKKNNKKGKTSTSESSETASLNEKPVPFSTNKTQKNDKNSKKQQQQHQSATKPHELENTDAVEKRAPETSAGENSVTDEVKPAQSAKAKKQKNKKENKKAAAAAKKQQDVKSNVSSLSEDIPLNDRNNVAPKSKSTPPAVAKSSKDKLNEKEMDVVIKSDATTDNDTEENAIDDNKVHGSGGVVSEECTLVSEIAKARQHLKNSLERMDDIASLAGQDVLDRISALEKENATLRQVVDDLRKLHLQSEDRIKSLETRLGAINVLTTKATAPVVAAVAPTSSAAKNNNDDDDDDGVDLFASDSEEEDDAAAKLREQRLAEYAAKKSKKPALVAKSNVILDVKPWDDETDMKQMETLVRQIQTDGLLWGTARLVPLAFGIHKLTISCVVEDEKVSIDWLTEEIEKNEDFVQSVDVAAFNKI